MTVTKSASQEIWQKWGRNLLVDLVTLIKSASKEICCRNWEAVNLLADLVTVNTSVSQGNWQAEMLKESAGRFSDCHHICQSGKLLVDFG